jgi:cell division protein FtsN
VARARNRRRTSAVAGTRRRNGAPAWVLVLAGLAVGAFVVAAAWVVRDRLAAQPAPTAAAPARPVPKPRARPSEAPPEKRFEFYEMLPNFEVVVPEEDRDVRRNGSPAPVDVPGMYVLQAGSYGSFAEADRVKAQLALLGIGSQIQKITVEDRQYHRVRIGPLDDLAELNRYRKRLREAGVEALVIRVGE